MEYIHFARIDSNTKKVIYVTPLSKEICLNVNGKIDIELSNEYLKYTIPDSKNDTWLELDDVLGKKGGIGYSYDENLKAFIPPKPFESWILNTQTFEWEPPVPKPESNFTVEPFYDFIWNEETLSWDQIF